MENITDNYSFEYQYIPSPDAEERLAQAWDLILTLILEDIKSEQLEQQEPGGDTSRPPRVRVALKRGSW